MSWFSSFIWQDYPQNQNAPPLCLSAVWCIVFAVRDKAFAAKRLKWLRLRALGVILASCGVVSAEPTNAAPLRAFPGSTWIDQTHSNMEDRIQRTAVWLDSRFGDASVMTGRTADCTAMIGAEVLHEEGGALTTRARGRLSLDLPRMENSMRLYVDNVRHDLLPGVNPIGGDDKFRIGARWRFFQTVFSLLDFDAGVRPRLPPEPFARVRYGYRRQLGEWEFVLGQRCFWTTDDHLGELTAVTFTHPLWESCLFRSVTAGKFSQKSEGLESEQTCGVAIQFAGGTRQIDLSGSVFAERNDIVNYRLSLGWRARWLRPWNTFYVTPEVQFPVEEDLHPRPSIRIGVETVY